MQPGVRRIRYTVLTALLSCPILHAADGGIFERAAAYYGVNPELLHAIARVESGMDPGCVNRNANGTEDIGLMQINSVHLPELARYGIGREDLFDPEVNVYIGAWVLAGCMKRHGNTWRAVNCYNGRIDGNPYAAKVYRVLRGRRK